MADPEVSYGFKPCYRHPRRPAIRSCTSCKRPICMECGKESGNVQLCPSCATSTRQPAESMPEEKPIETPTPPDRETPTAVGEVTVFEDGTVTAPETADEPEPTNRSASQAPGSAYADGQPLPQPETTVATNAAPPVSIAVAQATDKPGPAKSSRLRSLGGKITDKLSVDWSPRIETVLKIGRALPRTIIAAVIVTGIWLLLAFWFRGHWSQVSILTLGIVVPWVLYNALTRKKRWKRVTWLEPPPMYVISLTSLAVVILFGVILEMGAFLIASEGTVSFSAFARAYFWKPLDLIMLILALPLAAGIPFLMKVGASGKMRSFARRSKKPATATPALTPPTLEDGQAQAAATAWSVPLAVAEVDADAYADDDDDDWEPGPATNEDGDA